MGDGAAGPTNSCGCGQAAPSPSAGSFRHQGLPRILLGRVVRDVIDTIPDGSKIRDSLCPGPTPTLPATETPARVSGPHAVGMGQL